MLTEIIMHLPTRLGECVSLDVLTNEIVFAVTSFVSCWHDDQLVVKSLVDAHGYRSSQSMSARRST